MILMRAYLIAYIALPLVLSSCNNSARRCEELREWKVDKYRIIEAQCPDMVLAHYYTYSIYEDKKELGNISHVD